MNSKYRLQAIRLYKEVRPQIVKGMRLVLKCGAWQLHRIGREYPDPAQASLRFPVSSVTIDLGMYRYDFHGKLRRLFESESGSTFLGNACGYIYICIA